MGCDPATDGGAFPQPLWQILPYRPRPCVLLSWVPTFLRYNTTKSHPNSTVTVSSYHPATMPQTSRDSQPPTEKCILYDYVKTNPVLERFLGTKSHSPPHFCTRKKPCNTRLVCFRPWKLPETAEGWREKEDFCDESSFQKVLETTVQSHRCNALLKWVHKLRMGTILKIMMGLGFIFIYCFDCKG